MGGGIKECIGMRMGWPSYAQSAQLRCSSLFCAVQKTSAKLTAPHTQTFGQIINATYVTQLPLFATRKVVCQFMFFARAEGPAVTFTQLPTPVGTTVGKMHRKKI